MPTREARKDLKLTPIIKIERARGARSKPSRRQEITEIRAELKEIETKKTL